MSIILWRMMIAIRLISKLQFPIKRRTNGTKEPFVQTVKSSMARTIVQLRRNNKLNIQKLLLTKNNNREVSWILNINTQGIEDDKWYLDSSCSSHIGNHKEIFTNSNLEEGLSVASPTESVKDTGKNDTKNNNIKLTDTLYILDAQYNLLSISTITRKSGNCINFTSNSAFMLFPKEVTLNSTKRIDIMVDV